MKKTVTLVLASLWCLILVAQNATVSGSVVDDTGSPLIGANVLVKGVASGTATDMDGQYTLSVPPGNQTIVVTYIRLHRNGKRPYGADGRKSNPRLYLVRRSFL